MKLRAILLAAVVAVGFAGLPEAMLGAPGAAHAQEFRPDRVMPDHGYGYGRDRDREERRQPARVRPLREIVDVVRSQRGGDLIDVLALEEGGDRPFYVLRWRLDNGVVRDFRVDAQSGQIMGR